MKISAINIIINSYSSQYELYILLYGANKKNFKNTCVYKYIYIERQRESGNIFNNQNSTIFKIIFLFEKMVY